MRSLSLLVLALVAAGLATLHWTTGPREPFDDAVTRAKVAVQADRPDSPCPLSETATRTRPAWLLAACADGGLGWTVAADRYGADAEAVFRVYGGDETFRRVFDRFGHPVVPVVAYVVEHGSLVYSVGNTVGTALTHLWSDGALTGGEPLTAEQAGLLAIHDIAARGHEVLAEFEIVDGRAVPKPLTQTLLGAKSVLFGGITDLETVLVRGERLPTWSEVGWAALDGAVVVGGVGAAAKVARGGRALTAAGPAATLRSAGVGATRSLATVGRAAGMVGLVAIPYVAVTRPGLLADAGGWMAEQVGLPAAAGVFAVWSIAFLAVAVVLRILLGPIAFLMRIATGVAGGMRRISRRAPRTARSAAVTGVQA